VANGAPIASEADPTHPPGAWHQLMTGLGRHLPFQISVANGHAKAIRNIVTPHAKGK
jgi:hypothetical protein